MKKMVELPRGSFCSGFYMQLTNNNNNKKILFQHSNLLLFYLLNIDGQWLTSMTLHFSRWLTINVHFTAFFIKPAKMLGMLKNKLYILGCTIFLWWLKGGWTNFCYISFIQQLKKNTIKENVGGNRSWWNCHNEKK